MIILILWSRKILRLLRPQLQKAQIIINLILLLSVHQIPALPLPKIHLRKLLLP